MNTFNNYADKAIISVDSPEGIMLNGHSVHSIFCHKNKNVLDQRMYWIVNNYTNYENIDKRPYYEYYKANINDTYNQYEIIEKLLPSPNYEYEDDIDIHYRELNNKYAALAKLNEKLQQNNNEIPEITEPYEYQESTESEYQSTIEEYDDDIYIETDEEYYEMCLDDQEYEDDDYDY